MDGPQPGLTQPQLSHLQNGQRAAISAPSSSGIQGGGREGRGCGVGAIFDLDKVGDRFRHRVDQRLVEGGVVL